jgi:hypothetical protein
MKKHDASGIPPTSKSFKRLISETHSNLPTYPDLSNPIGPVLAESLASDQKRSPQN